MEVVAGKRSVQAKQREHEHVVPRYLGASMGWASWAVHLMGWKWLLVRSSLEYETLSVVPKLGGLPKWDLQEFSVADIG